MKILAFDSSAKSASVALIDDNKIIGSFFINANLTHSQTLVPMANQLLENTQTDLNQIDALAVSVGPGSFTGVRIGVSIVKGLSMTSDIPCIPVSTLEAMAYNYIQENCTVVAVMDARCNQVYNANFSINNGVISRLCNDRALAIDDLYKEIKTINDKIILVGDGAELCYNSYKEKSINIFLASEHIRYQNATSVAYAALNKDKISAEQLMPVYLRLPQAQRELNKRLESQK
ncbi:MAG: tRNA (adenosine(37)-N6)-threonylcarbamoyltransferase complex dimerization subunit type 1 TsaB [Ruminococcus sp.]